MKNILKFSLILSIILLFSVAVVSASDINATDNNLEINESYSDSPILGENYDNESSQILEEDSQLSDEDSQVSSQDSKDETEDLTQPSVDSQKLTKGNSTVKDTPVISINSKSFYTGGTIKITLKNSNATPIAKQNLTVKINSKTHVLLTNKDGIAGLKLNLPGKDYNIKITYSGNGKYNSVSKTFKITVKKICSRIYPVSKKVLNGKYFYAYLKDSRGYIANANLQFTLNGKTYKVKTNSNGRASFKVKQKVGKYSFKMYFAGDGFHKGYSEKAHLYVPVPTAINIGNKILLTKGFMRIYLKCKTPSTVAKHKVTVTIGSKKFSKKSNSEGVVVFKPGVGAGVKKVTVKLRGNYLTGSSSASKKIKVISGNVKDPLKKNVKLRNGVPNIDYMPGCYVMANANGKYSLTKAQYKEVLKRDKYSLYLHNKLSKYTFFKSKAEPKMNHIIKREKWNVIERQINKKVVLANSHNYWPKEITVNLKGKSLHYPEVRDIQNTGYTCGPTSASMCTQVLRHYFNEAFLGYEAGSNAYSGSSTSGLKYALEKHNFKCKYYYKSSWSTALKALKKGGCALIFHTWNHYVAILDISKDGKKVLVGNPSGDYNHGSHSIPTNWLTVKHMYGRFNNYDTSGLIVKLKFNKMSKSTKSKINHLYYSMGAKWSRTTTNERIPDIGY